MMTFTYDAKWQGQTCIIAIPVISSGRLGTTLDLMFDALGLNVSAAGQKTTDTTQPNVWLSTITTWPKRS